MKHVKAILLAIALVLGFSGSTALMATAAHASPATEDCDWNGSPLFCLNDWSGSGSIASYQYGSAQNNNFYYQPVYGRCVAGSDRTTTGCPFPGVGAGHLIFQVVYANNGQCMGTVTGGGNAGVGVLTGCNNVNTGYGGGVGTIYANSLGGCPSGTAGWYNSYWSNADGSPQAVRIRDNNGDSVYVNQGLNGSCVGQYSG